MPNHGVWKPSYNCNEEIDNRLPTDNRVVKEMETFDGFCYFVIFSKIVQRQIDRVGRGIVMRTKFVLILGHVSNDKVEKRAWWLKVVQDDEWETAL